MKKGPRRGGASDISKIVRMIMERQYDPVIVFSFSKKDCEAHALEMSRLDFTSGRRVHVSACFVFTVCMRACASIKVTVLCGASRIIFCWVSVCVLVAFAKPIASCQCIMRMCDRNVCP